MIEIYDLVSFDQIGNVFGLPKWYVTRLLLLPSSQTVELSVIFKITQPLERPKLTCSTSSTVRTSWILLNKFSSALIN